MKIAFVGLGAMGRPMAARLAAAGHGVVGFDVNEDGRTAIEQAGGTFTSDAAGAARGAEALVTMVVSGDQAEDALFESGMAAALPEGAIVIAGCTQPRGQAEAMGERLAGMGLRFLDAPVSGGVVGARDGTLTVMASGPHDTFEAARPVLEAYGDKLHHVGEAWGLGSLTKAINQHLAGIHLAAAGEAMAFGAKAGLDGEQMLAIYTQSAAGSWMLANRGPRMLETEPEVTSAVNIFVKDLGIVRDTAREIGADVPLARTAHQRFIKAAEAGLGLADDSQIVRAFGTEGKDT